MASFLHWHVNSVVKNYFNIAPINHWTFTVKQVYVLCASCNPKTLLLYLNIHSVVLFSESKCFVWYAQRNNECYLQYLFQKWLHNKSRKFQYKCQGIILQNRKIIKKIIYNLGGTWLLLSKEGNQMKILNECYLFMEVPKSVCTTMDSITSIHCNLCKFYLLCVQALCHLHLQYTIQQS
jgi:hypothetical protein